MYPDWWGAMQKISLLPIVYIPKFGLDEITQGLHHTQELCHWLQKKFVLGL